MGPLFKVDEDNRLTRGPQGSVQVDLQAYEASWEDALEGLGLDPSMATLQCYVLAQIFYLATGGHEKLQRYRSLAVGLSHRLGLHRSQKRFALGELTSETRKKVFWCLYTVDWSVPCPPPSTPIHVIWGSADPVLQLCRGRARSPPAAP